MSWRDNLYLLLVCSSGLVYFLFQHTLLIILLYLHVCWIAPVCWEHLIGGLGEYGVDNWSGLTKPLLFFVSFVLCGCKNFHYRSSECYCLSFSVFFLSPFLQISLVILNFEHGGIFPCHIIISKNFATFSTWFILPYVGSSLSILLMQDSFSF